MPKIEFWFEFASTYTYLSVMRIEEMAAQRGVKVEWKPFLLGPIFQAQGWNNTPFRLYPNKGLYMIRDMERLAAERGIPFKLSRLFPQNGLNAARLAMVGAEEAWGPPFTREVFLRQFRDEADISDKAVLAEALVAAGQDAEQMLGRIQQPDVKDALKRQTEHALSFGIFGAPTFITEDHEMFWGDDRLEQALEWAARGGGVPEAPRNYA